MNLFRKIKSFLVKRPEAIVAILLSGMCWYFGNGLSGKFWFLMWIAPVPVLHLSLKISSKRSFFIGFLAYLLGRLSWFKYLVMVATLIPAVIFTLVFPLVFALILVLTRKMILKTASWYSVLFFPVFFTAFEYLMFSLSPDGTAASIAYSQSDLLPLIQLASLTGVLGITFIITFIPAGITLAIFYHENNSLFRKITVMMAFVMLSVFLFGSLRIYLSAGVNSIKAGLVVLDEKLHDMSAKPDPQKEKQLAEAYVTKISELARQGAEIIVLPERAVGISKESEIGLMNIFKVSAIQNKVNLIIGYTNLRNDKEYNSALVIDKKGNILSDYRKVHLVTGLENRFTPGSETGIVTMNGIRTGTAICKDLDFPDYIRNYGKSGTSLLMIPAWDFTTDDWLHSRMAIMRGVENGFSEIRTARLGRLTISDCYGRVTAEAKSSKGNAATLAGDVRIRNKHTFYARFGNWFGIINLSGALGFILLSFIKRTRTKADAV